MKKGSKFQKSRFQKVASFLESVFLSFEISKPHDHVKQFTKRTIIFVLQ